MDLQDVAQVVGGLMDKEDWVTNLKHLDLVGDLQEMAQVVLEIDLNNKEDLEVDQIQRDFQDLDNKEDLVADLGNALVDLVAYLKDLNQDNKEDLVADLNKYKDLVADLKGLHLVDFKDLV